MNKTSERAQANGLRQFESSSKAYVIGVDEVGVGAWAGPLVVAGVVLKKGWGHPSLKDSKKFNNTSGSSAHEKRTKVLHTVIKPNEIFQMVVKFSSKQIDQMGMHVALRKAKEKIVRHCSSFYPDSIVVLDGLQGVEGTNGRYEIVVFPKADQLVPAVSAASILAKVTRDSLMISVDNAYPEYGFAEHSGYGTKKHREALFDYGPCPIHRFSYKSVKNLSELFQRVSKGSPR